MFGKLESLRGVAACLVVLFHSPFNYGLKPIEFMQNSYLFVDFFFILSGFVMSYAYGEKINRDLSFGSYITLRLGRIYPLHLFMLLAWVPYILIKQYLYNSGFGGTDPSEKSNVLSFVSNLFLVHSLGVHSYIGWNYPSWSISTEFFAYIAFYFISTTIDKHKSIYIPMIITVLGYLFLLSLDRPGMDITYDFGFIRCLAAFYIGVLLFRLQSHKVVSNSTRLLSVLETFSVAALIIAVNYAGVNKIALVVVIAIFALVLVIFANSNNGILGRLLETHFMRQLGVWSYSMYMIHALVWAGVSNIFEHIFKINLDAPQGVLALAVNLLLLGVIIFISKYSYIYIEKKFRDLIKTKVSQRSKVIPPTVMPT